MNPELIARITHEANRVVQIATDDPVVSPTWDDAPDWQRESSIEGVQHTEWSYPQRTPRVVVSVQRERWLGLR